MQDVFVGTPISLQLYPGMFKTLDGIFDLGSFAWDMLLGNSRLGSSLGFSGCNRSFEIFRLEYIALDLSLGIFDSTIPRLGNWLLRLGGHTARSRGNPEARFRFALILRN